MAIMRFTAALAAVFVVLMGSVHLAATEEKKVPKLLWAQRRHLLYLRVVIPDLLPSTLKVTLNDTHVAVSGQSGEDQSLYAVRAHLFRKIEPAGSSWEVNDLGEIQFILQKFWEWRYWPRLLHTYNAESRVQQNLQVDWKRWKPEFDVDSNDEDDDIMMPGEDADWLDDEIAIKKPAKFAEESFNRSHMALLDDATLKPFLQLEGKPQQAAVVLFFERTYNKKLQMHQQLHRLFAATASVVHKKVAMGAVDAKASSKLMRKMRLTQFPAAKIFFPNGDMFDFNPTELKNVKTFAMYLFRQLNPAWVDISDVDTMARVFTQAPRVALGIFDEEEKIPAEGVSDLAAKTYRAMPSPPPVLFARMNSSLLPDIYDAGVRNSTIAEIMDRIQIKGLTIEGFRGIVMVKNHEEPQKYKGPMKKSAMVGWIYTKHFNDLEEISPRNFQEFRRRNIPIMYILLDDNEVEHQPMLKSILPLAKEYYGRVSFVYTRVSGMGDLMEHLRCEYQGTTFAVMEDFVDDYRFCADATPTKPLTRERLRKLTEGVLANSAKPDKVASQPIPDKKKNTGPVYNVVSDNLMETVMENDMDVVVHFYAEFDEKWDEDEFELAKLGEAVEDVKKLKVTRVNGILNEKPSEFPDIGYIPCTWIFPANSKHMPQYFNKTVGGFNAYRLLNWVKATASHPVDVDDLPNPDPFATTRDLATPPLPAVAEDGEGVSEDSKEAPREQAQPHSEGPEKPSKKPKAPKKPKSQQRAKLDDVMKEINALRKGMKDEL